ncbi:hypothetical protein CMK10_05195 [Candidatus Poribacteria bacterium]|nr:hypothetical protein [Candidatus Poribacteria bacterium]MEC8892525.1 bifunctional oligoribonuclease/PAP phosphatase NrnA [Candidatus Poribacteria bacterium]
MDIYHKILDLIDQHSSFAISAHVNPDGDSIGSQLALYSFLANLDKHVRIFNTDPVPPNYHFLPFYDKVEQPCTLDGYSPEVLIVLDASTLVRIGNHLSKVLIPKQVTINIDHHASADRFGDYNLVESGASSTCEIVYKLIQLSGTKVGYKRAMALYTGIMFDTGCFRYSNSTSQVHHIAANLIDQGIEVDKIYREVYETNPVRRLRLLTKALETVELTPDGKIAWLVVNQKMLNHTGTTLEDADGIINQIRSIDTIEVAIMVVSNTREQSKISMRSKDHVDVGKICAEFGGGGHARAAGCLIDKSYKIALEMVIEVTRKYIAYDD